MYIYQNGKLYVKLDGEMVGVNGTPTNLTPNKERVKYTNGLLLDVSELVAKFGVNYQFGVDEVDNGTEIDNDETAPKRRGRKSR